MDGLEFASKVIEHGAWPAIAVYVAVTQKDGIKALLSRMSKFKAPGMEAEFDTKAEQAAEKIEERSATPVAAPKLEPSVVEQVVQDTERIDPANAKRLLDRLKQGVSEHMRRPPEFLHPQEQRLHDERLRASGRIIEEWANLDETIRLLGATKGYQDARAVSTTKLINRLVEIGVISPSTADSIKELRALRNQVAHTQFEPTREAAENFADSCWKVEKRIIEEEAAWQEVATKLADEMLAEMFKPK